MRTAPRKPALALAALITASGLALAGCSSGSSPAPTTSDDGKLEKTSITFGILPTPDYAPVQIAINEGFFEKEGLEVKLETINSATNMSNLLNGTLSITGVNWIQYGQATSKGIELVPVTQSDLGTPGYAEIMVWKDSPAKGLEDLGGKTVGVVATPGNCDQIPLAKIAAKGSSAEPKFVNIAIPEMAGQLERGGIDAACVPEPTLSALKATGNFRSIDDLFSGDYENFPIVGFSTSKQFAEQNPNTVRAVTRAITKAMDFISANPDAVRKALPQYTQIPEQAANVMVLPKYATPPTDLSNLDIVAQVLKSTKLVPDAKFPTKVAAG